MTETGINGGGNCFFVLATVFFISRLCILPEEEVSGSIGLRSVIEVWAALASSRNSSTAEEKQCIEMHYMEIDYRPLQRRVLTLGVVVVAWESVVAVDEARGC